jgi:hypothetical protein
MTPTNEELEALMTREQLNFNIAEKNAKILEYETGLHVLRNSPTPDDPFVVGRISLLESKVADYREAIQTWKLLLANLKPEA